MKFHDMVTVSLGGTGTITINHVINGTGGPSDANSNVANVTEYP